MSPLKLYETPGARAALMIAGLPAFAAPRIKEQLAARRQEQAALAALMEIEASIKKLQGQIDVVRRLELIEEIEETRASNERLMTAVMLWQAVTIN